MAYYLFKNEEGEEIIVEASSKKEVVSYFKVQTSKVKKIKEVLPEDIENVFSIKEEKRLQEEKKEILSLEKRLNYLEDSLNLNQGDKIFFRRKVHFVLEKISKIGYKIKDDKTIKIVPFFDLEPFTEKEVKILNRKTLRLDFYNTSLDTILSRYYHFGVNLSPSYQRDLVWNKENKEKLIEALFSGRDIGKFVFVSDDTSDILYEILDGKQRLTTIIEYVENKFSYKGVFYKDLSMEDRRIFKNRTVSIADIDKHFYTDKDIVSIFVDLNDTGVPVSKEFLDKIKKDYL